MQWKQIKSLFILCFLVLNIYLLFMFFDKQEASDYGVADLQTPALKEQLKSEDITISADLPEEELNESYISVSQKQFSDKEMEFLDELDNQQTKVINSDMILSRFDEPVAIPEDADSTLITDLVKSRIVAPDSYTYGTWNKKMNVLVLFQKKKERPIYYNQSGIVLVYLNDENEMTFYTQTMLGKTSIPSDKESLVAPMTAIEVLFQGNRLWSGDEITEVNMGFHTRIPLESGEQVFAPTWAITVNEEENYYVNALENLVFSSDEETFLTDTIESTIKKIQKFSDDTELNRFIINRLEPKINNKQSE